MKKYQSESFLSEIFQILEVKFSIYLNMRVFIKHQRPNERFKSCLFIYSENMQGHGYAGSTLIRGC